MKRLLRGGRVVDPANGRDGIFDILIEEGLIEEGVVAAADESALRVGMALRAVAVALPGGETFACRFVPAAAGAAE